MTDKIDMLLVEDNEDFIVFFQRALKNVNDKISFKTFNHGVDALNFVDKTTPAKHGIKMILLDINLPGMDGIDILKNLRKKAKYKFIPVIMFSSSDNPEDIKNSYEQGANAYLMKPEGMQQLTSTLQSICEFWLRLNHHQLN